MKRFPGRLHPRTVLATALVACGLLARVAWMANAPFPDHFWMDERFTAAAVSQPLDRLVLFCRRDVHPPLYYLALKGWNELGLVMAPDIHPPEAIVDYRLPGIGRTGYFTIEAADGSRREAPGLYPRDWPQWPLAPLWFLRLPSVGMALLAAAIFYGLGRRLWREHPSVATAALGMTLFSPFMMTWDTVMRSYALMGALGAVMGWLAVRPPRKWVLCAITFWIATSVALLTGYVLILLLPCLLAAMWVLHRNWRQVAATAAGMGIGGMTFLLLWGGAFFQQSALRQAPDSAQGLARIGSGMAEMAGIHWQMLFSYGMTANLNPFEAPVGYALAFVAYAACLGAMLFQTLRLREKADVAIVIMAVGPAILAALINALRPESIPIQARYFYAFAPFFFLLLARGAHVLATPICSGRHR